MNKTEASEGRPTKTGTPPRGHQLRLSVDKNLKNLLLNAFVVCSHSAFSWIMHKQFSKPLLYAFDCNNHHALFACSAPLYLSNGLHGTFCQKSHNMVWNMGEEKVADFNKCTVATQLSMMQSLQPNTLWFAVCIPAFSSQFHSSWQTHNMVFEPHSNCPACAFDKMKKGNKITFIQSLVWGLNSCHQTKGGLATLWS